MNAAEDVSDIIEEQVIWSPNCAMRVLNLLSNPQERKRRRKTETSHKGRF